MSDLVPRHLAFRCVQCSGLPPPPLTTVIKGTLLAELLGKMEKHVDLDAAPIPPPPSPASDTSSSGQSSSSSTRSGGMSDQEDGDFEPWKGLRSTDTQRLVEEFEKNIVKLLTSPTTRAAATKAAMKVFERQRHQNDVGAESDESDGSYFCRRFREALDLEDSDDDKRQGRNKGQGAAGGLFVPDPAEVLLETIAELERRGQEFNPFRLVTVIGEKLGHVGELLDMIQKEKEMEREKAQEAMQLARDAAEVMAADVKKMEAALAQATKQASKGPTASNKGRKAKKIRKPRKH